MRTALTALHVESEPLHVIALARHTTSTPVELRPPADRVQNRPKAQARITLRDRERIVKLYEHGRSGSRIAADLNIANSTVYASAPER